MENRISIRLDLVDRIAAVVSEHVTDDICRSIKVNGVSSQVHLKNGQTNLIGQHV